MDGAGVVFWSATCFVSNINAGMKSTLEAIRFFANSANAVRVFEELADGPASSRDLAERTGASRSTVARILDDGESRGWISSTGSRYELTTVGQVMIEAFRDHMETVEGVRHLGEAVNWLPPPAHEIDYRDLRTAVVTQSTPDNPAAAFDRGLELIREAGRYRGLTFTAVPSYVAALGAGLRERELDFEGVIEAGFLETLREDPERVGPWRELAQTGSVWVYPGTVPINLHVVDDTTAVWLGRGRADELDVYGLLESDEPSVLAWAESLFAQYRSDGELLEEGMLPGP